MDFRAYHSRLIARLVGQYGADKLAAIQDGVQHALLSAVRLWPEQGQPQHPYAWLHRAAHNYLLDQFRYQQRWAGDDEPLEHVSSAEVTESCFSGEWGDDDLRMLFICCDPALKAPSQLVLGLKVLLGFGKQDIALRLLISEEVVKKRLTRAQHALRERWQGKNWQQQGDIPHLLPRLGQVQRMLYLLFTEGYHSNQSDQPIRADLCQQAIDLVEHLAKHPRVNCPSNWALLGIMLMHQARLASRVNALGELLLLEQQDRSLWQKNTLWRAMQCLNRANDGQTLSRYHLEAAILAEHCFSESYAHTRWGKIDQLYQQLETHYPNPLYTLNRAIAVSQYQGPEAGLALLKLASPPAWLNRYYLWNATLGELLIRAGHMQQAIHPLTLALQAAPTSAEQQLLRTRLASAQA